MINKTLMTWPRSHDMTITHIGRDVLLRHLTLWFFFHIILLFVQKRTDYFRAINVSGSSFHVSLKARFTLPAEHCSEYYNSPHLPDRQNPSYENRYNSERLHNILLIAPIACVVFYSLKNKTSVGCIFHTQVILSRGLASESTKWGHLSTSLVLSFCLFLIDWCIHYQNMTTAMWCDLCRLFHQFLFKISYRTYVDLILTFASLRGPRWWGLTYVALSIWKSHCVTCHYSNYRFLKMACLKLSILKWPRPRFMSNCQFLNGHMSNCRL